MAVPLKQDQATFVAIFKAWKSKGTPSIEAAASLEDRVVTALYINKASWWWTERPKPQLFFRNPTEDIAPPENTKDIFDALPGTEAEYITAAAACLSDDMAGKVLLSAYIHSHGPTSLVEIRPSHLGTELQLGVFARFRIAAGIPISHFAGFLSQAGRGPPSMARVSQYKKQIVVGPLRFVNSVCGNNSCDKCQGRLNCRVQPIKAGRTTLGLSIVTIREIEKGQQLLISYGTDYCPWNGMEPVCPA